MTHRTMSPLLSMIAAASLVGVTPTTQARGPGSNCPDSIISAGVMPDLLSFSQLAPGTTQLTPGTSAATNTDLDGVSGATVNKTVAWSTSAGLISVRLRHKVFDSATASNVCSCTYQAEVQAPSAPGTGVCAIVVSNFIYPTNGSLYGAYRTDGSPKGQVKSISVTRSSGKGRTMRFELDGCVVPGQLSKPVTLVFHSDQIFKDGRVQFEDQDGNLSPAIRVFNPYIP